MAGKLKLIFEDYDFEKSVCEFRCATLDESNVAAQTALADTLQTAVAGITLGNIRQDELFASVTPYSNVGSDQPDAQREMRWLVVAEDETTFKKHRISLPTAELDFLAVNSKHVDETEAAWIAFKAAFEALVVAPDTGNSLTILSCTQTGANV
jgi:hypothetical protein